MVRQDGGATRPPGGGDPRDETLDGTEAPSRPHDHTLDSDSVEGKAIVARATRELAVGETLDSDPGGPMGSTPAPRVTVNQFPIAHWDRYEFLKLLGQGGMGAVYKARDRRLGRIVALKFIRSGDEAMTNRFMQEARAQSRIDHPGICKVLEVGEVEGKAYIAMQFVDGLSLQQSSPGMTLLEKVQIIREVAEALHTAHEQNIIHRDIKPSNIMVELVEGEGGGVRYRPVVMDFGLAREAGEGKGLTESGAVMGTPAYMSPEQARGEVRKLDRRTDVYSLGATLYDLLAGHPPFEDETVVNILMKVLNDDVPPLRQKVPDVPEALDTIANKCLSKEPSQRYATAKELADDLGRYLGNQRIVGKRASLTYRMRYRAQRNKPLVALGGALLLSVVGLGGYGVRNYVQSARKEALAREHAELAQKLGHELGQTVKDLEWLVRTSYSLPLHDTSYEKALVRERMAELDEKLRSYGAVGAGLGHYALGRGHLALHEFAQAHEHLKQAEDAGIRDPELDFALGRVLGELFSKAFDDARKSGDKSFVEKRRQELTAQYLAPALRHLEKSRARKTVSTSYVEGLIDYYNQRYDAALLNAHMAQKKTPWLYEATKLEGDVHVARALDQKDHGDYDQAERSYQEAIRRYEQAAQIGRSDYQIYEAIAEAWIRQEEMDGIRGKSPQQKMEQALAAAERAIESAPKESYGYTKKGFAYLFQARYEQERGAVKEMLAVVPDLIEAGTRAFSLHSDDIYAYDVTAIGHMIVGAYKSSSGGDYEASFQKTRTLLQTAISINSRFPWAYNDLGIIAMLDGVARLSKNQAPDAQFKDAIEAFNRALSIDKDYYYVHANLAYIYNNFSQWKFEHGLNPEAVIANNVESANAAITSDKKLHIAYWNLGSGYVAGAFYDYYNLHESSKYIKLAYDSFDKLFAVNPNIADAYIDYTNAFYTEARFLIRQSKDPAATIEAGLSAIKKCYQANNNVHYGCMANEGLLLSLWAEWLAAQSLPSAAKLSQAINSAKTSRQHAATDNNVLLAAAEVHLRSARIQQAAHRKPTSDLTDGLAAIEQALKIAPGFPRALALQGALLLLRARQQQPGSEAAEWSRQAQAALGQAIQANPLLKNLYGELLREAEALTGASAAK